MSGWYVWGEADGRTIQSWTFSQEENEVSEWWVYSTEAQLEHGGRLRHLDGEGVQSVTDRGSSDIFTVLSELPTLTASVLFSRASEAPERDALLSGCSV